MKVHVLSFLAGLAYVIPTQCVAQELNLSSKITPEVVESYTLIYEIPCSSQSDSNIRGICKIFKPPDGSTIAVMYSEGIPIFIRRKWKDKEGYQILWIKGEEV